MMLVALAVAGALSSLYGLDVSLHLVIKLLSFWTFLALPTTASHLLPPVLTPSDLFATWLIGFTQGEEMSKRVL